jgi:hypothetical protein
MISYVVMLRVFCGVHRPLSPRPIPFGLDHLEPDWLGETSIIVGKKKRRKEEQLCSPPNYGCLGSDFPHVVPTQGWVHPTNLFVQRSLMW